jgi:hypothetical protein
VDGIRRVLTTWGQSTGGSISSDGPSPRLVDDKRFEGTVGVRHGMLWCGDSVPSLDEVDDPVTMIDGRPRDIYFLVVEFAPGAWTPPHRTLTFDLVTVLEGEIVLRQGDEEVVLTTGDHLVQRGGVHSWENRSGSPCLLTFVVIRATRP